MFSLNIGSFHFQNFPYIWEYTSKTTLQNLKRTTMTPFAAEIIGTMILMLLGTGVNANTSLDKTYGNNSLVGVWLYSLQL